MKFKIFGKEISIENFKKREVVIEETKDLQEDYSKEIVEVEDKPRLIFNINNNYLTVIFSDGETLCGQCDVLQYARIKLLSNKEDIIRELTPVKEEVKIEPSFEEEQEAEIIKDYLGIFKDSKDFEVHDNKLYFKGIKSIAIPSSIVAYFIELLENQKYATGSLEINTEYNSLKMFALKLLINPIPKSREHLLNFVKKFNVDLTASGNMILERNIVTLNKTNRAYVEFVSNQYLKVKGQKKSPKNYFIYEDLETKELFLNNFGDETKIKDHTQFMMVANLNDTYVSLNEKQEKTYTDNHTKTYDIKIGSIYKIREQDIELNKNGSCGGLLHCAAKNSYDYSAFGDQRVVVLVNPSFAARMDTGCSGKIGVEQMFILAALDKDEEVPNLIELDTEYDRLTMKDLEESLKNKSFASVSIGEAVTELSIPEIKNISAILKSRVVSI